MSDTPAEVQFTSAGCLNYPCRTPALSTRINVDDAVKIAAIDFALDGVGTIILCASDGGYAEVIKAIRDCGIKVELWCLREAVCRKLLFVADQIFWMDHLVAEPTEADTGLSLPLTTDNTVQGST